MTTIPASLFVNVTPSVIAAGGSGLNLIGLALTKGTRVPIGSVYSFPSASAVSSFFGPTSVESRAAGGAAGFGSGYFGAFDNSFIKPAAMLFAQYNTTDVSAWLQGGKISGLTLTQLQAISGTLSVTIDGVLKTSSINLSAATSFSNAAEIIANDLGIAGVAVGTVTGSIGGTGGTCTTTGTTLTMGSLASGKFQVGDTLTANDGSGHTLVSQTIVAQLTGTPGGSAGATFQMSGAATGGDLTSTTVTAKGPTLTVTVLGTAAAVGVADTISGTGITAGSYIVAQVTPLIGGEATGGVGRYTINAAQAGVVASETITLDTPAVQYDSVSGAFLIYSGTTGAASTITYSSGAAGTSLLLTAATGAVLSQGAVATNPTSFMNNVITVTTNWATFFTTFDPDASGNANKQLFAGWVNGQNDRYAYVCWDTDVTPTQSVPATSSLGYILQQSGSNGTIPIYESSDLNQAAFVSGAIASIDFTRTNGRTTLAYRAQSGLVADVTTQSAAVNLGGNPQVSGDYGNGYNYYGAIGSGNINFVNFQRGSISGTWKWIDSYVNQIAFNAQAQAALMTFLQNAPSVPFNDVGASAIDNALLPTIQQYLAFGMYSAGVNLSASQISEVNAQAGTDIASTLQTQGWYLQILPANAATRAARGPWAITFWYVDGQSVQSISLSSVAVQ